MASRGGAGDAGTALPFGAPLVLDLGCGNGAFAAGLAALRPDWNVLGVEQKGYRVRQARRRAADLSNVQVVRGEVTEVLDSLPERSAERVYLLFSDPWPKRRHAVRRLVQREFVALLGTRMAPDGSFFFASDSPEYATWAVELFRAGGWRTLPWDPPADWPATEFEQRFAAAGVEIRRFEATR